MDIVYTVTETKLIIICFKVIKFFDKENTK